MADCPYCHREGTVDAHVRLCPDNPTVYAAIGDALRDPHEPTRALSAERYNAQRVLYGAPVASGLLLRYGSWGDVCAEYGLEKPRRNVDELIVKSHSPTNCPHCNKSFATGVMSRHAAVCPDNPDVAPRIAAAIEDANAPGFAVTAMEYAEISKGASIPGIKAIKAHYGSWRNAVQHFGLQLAEENQEGEHLRARRPLSVASQQMRREVMEEQQIVAWERRTLEHDAQAAHTLHGYNPRDLPGVTVNGKPCQVISLR